VTTRTHFTFRIDTWTPDGESIVEHVTERPPYRPLSTPQEILHAPCPELTEILANLSALNLQPNTAAPARGASPARPQSRSTSTAICLSPTTRLPRSWRHGH
jgi:hypothetical protein